MADIVERLRGIYRVPIADGLGKVEGNLEPDNEKEFVRKFDAPPIQRDAADEIERLRIELAAKETEALGYLRAVGTLQGEVNTLSVRIAELEKALQPFAAVAKTVADNHPGWDHDGFAWGASPLSLTLGPFRRARALIPEMDVAMAYCQENQGE